MKVVYVIGPYRARTPNLIYHNIHEARAVAEELWERGYAVICPHLNSAFMDGLVPDDAFLRADHVLLRRSDAFALVKGWQASEGSREEVRLALDWGLEFVPTRKGVRVLKLEGWLEHAKRAAEPPVWPPTGI